MANKQLLNVVGSIGQDNLIAKLTPAAETFGIKINKLAAGDDTVIERGTVLCADENGKYSVFSGAEGTVPSAILTEPVTVTTAEDVTAVAYRSGNFNRKALIMGGDHTLTVSDEDALRKYDIILTDMIAANE